MPVDLFANAANTTLAAGISAGAVTLTVASSTPFPAVTTAAATQFRVIIDSELFIVTNVTGTTWTVTPGAEGTTQAAHASGAVVTAIVTAGGLVLSSKLFTRRGGQYTSPSTGMGLSTTTYVTLSRVSGDTDLVSGGNLVIPTGADGVWQFGASWAPGTTQSGGRSFFDINLNAGASIYRTSCSTLEDQTDNNATLALVAGDTVKFGVFTATNSSVSKVTVNAYRVGV